MTREVPTIRAVIYDVDGTLVNTEPQHVDAWSESLGHFGHDVIDLSGGFQATMAGKKPIMIAQRVWSRS